MSERKKNGIATEVWHATMEELNSEREQYQYMLEHEILTDCTFVVGPEDGETREFKAHRVIIARMSPVFAAMFLRGEMVEAKTGHVRVTDLSPNTFQLLLSSIYGKEPVMTNFHEAQGLLFAAHKYQMKVLLETCVVRMRALIKPTNIWTAFETADLLQETRLQETCLQVLHFHTLQCILYGRIVQASEKQLVLLLEQDELNVEDELTLMNIAVHWARREAQRRGLTGDDEGVRAVLEPHLLSLFRFLAMSPLKFMLGPGLAGWLTNNEKDAISECLLSKNCNKMPQHFSCVAQKRINETFVSRATQIPVAMSGGFICKRKTIGTRPNARHEVDVCYNNSHYQCVHAKLIFKVSSSCKWLGFVCANRCRADTFRDPTAFEAKNPLYQEKIDATTFEFNHTLATNFEERKIAETSYRPWDAEYNSTSSIIFKEPVTLVPNNWFAIEVAFQFVSINETSLYQVGPLGEYPNPTRARIVRTAAGVEFTFHTEKLKGYRTSLNDGVFEALIFSF